MNPISDVQCMEMQCSLAEKKERSLLGRSKLVQSLSFNTQLDNLKTNCGHLSRVGGVAG
jgi:hypothetical protein